MIGFDDTPVAKAVGLTSLSQPLAPAATHCVALLTTLLDGQADPGEPPANVLLDPSLVVRQSA
ncbi:hypothetical protein GCM10027612_75890 [Microbispora bryophytorum subsp. camponoti]